MEITESFRGVVEVSADIVKKNQESYEEGNALSLPAFELKPKKGSCMY